MAGNSGHGYFPSVEELSLGMAQMTLAGNTVPTDIFDSVEELAEKMDGLKISGQLKLAGLIALWVMNRYNPFKGSAVIRSHLGCGDLKKSIYRLDKKKCVKTAKVYLDRGTPPRSDEWDSLLECSVGLLANGEWGDANFRAETSKRLLKSAGGEIKSSWTPAPSRGSGPAESDEEEEPLEKVMEKATRKLIEEASRQSKKRRQEAMDAALELRDSFKIMSSREEVFSKLPKEEKTRWITTFSKCLQQVLDLNEGRRLYEYICSVGAR
ncbi:hypothetical protein [Tyulek (Tjuloc) virus]|uniref:Uncharacterized protein n=1 Tax=Tyulek (Tjuloc) virus TaxID=1204161 RepID=S4SG57_9ORTO|nr:hypothetical protein QK748_s2gp1 [Tjuloc virus]AFN73051.1 hypothetical protein [Tjuloc virus]